MNPIAELFVTADDRTGALEIGGIVANDDFSVPVGVSAATGKCCVVDIASRHVAPETAYKRMREAHSTEAKHRCHKMDAGMRGRWPHEVRALVDMGHRIAVVPSFPDAGRRCKDGVVYIFDEPVLDSPFGSDPLSAPCSNKPIEVLEDADCLTDAIEVWDANDNDDLQAAVKRCREEGRILVGPTGAVGAYAQTVFPHVAPISVELETPILIVCGSLNKTSRRQLRRLGEPIHSIDEDLPEFAGVAVWATEIPNAPIDIEHAENTARQIAKRVHEIRSCVSTLLIIGGDTAAAFVGDATLHALGCVAPGIPVSRFEDQILITKGGGIGEPDILERLVQRSDFVEETSPRSQ